MLEFSDSINGNLDLLRDLLSQLPPAMREDAKRAAIKVENMMTAIQKDVRTSPASALGFAFAVYLVAQRFVQAEREGPRSERLIQLLS